MRQDAVDDFFRSECLPKIWANRVWYWIVQKVVGVSEYHDRLSAIQRRRHSLAEASSYRHFIVQIQDLLIRSEEECVSFDNILEPAKSELVHSENERLKFESLVQREKNAITQKKRARDTRNLEENVTLQYNWK